MNDHQASGQHGPTKGLFQQQPFTWSTADQSHETPDGATLADLEDQADLEALRRAREQDDGTRISLADVKAGKDN